MDRKLNEEKNRLVPRRDFLGGMAVAASALVIHESPSQAGYLASRSRFTTPSVSTITPGANAFIVWVTLENVNSELLRSLTYSIAPKPGSISPPIQVSYSTAYMTERGFFDQGASTLQFPIFGLYASPTCTTNNITITVNSLGTLHQIPLSIPTTPWVPTTYSDYQVLTINFPRSSSVVLDYGLFLLKPIFGYGPIIMDTDGELRWVQPNTYLNGFESLFINNSVYLTNGTQFYQTTMDGQATMLHDFSSLVIDGNSINSVEHHNMDPSPRGVFLCAETATEFESIVLESDLNGDLVNSFNLYDIIANAMTAGGDTPSNFVIAGNDWFHNNANCYWPRYNTLVISSRENFVMGINYSTKQIEWILGDTSKYWATFPSLRKYALTLETGFLPGGSVAPQGQHAVSISPDGYLMMFDDGTQSFNQPNNNTDPGPGQRPGVPRKYAIDSRKLTAVEVWRYEPATPITSYVCSSVYQVGRTYLVDYAVPGIIVGIDRNQNTGFSYTYPGGFTAGWNAEPLDWTNLSFGANAKDR